MPPPIIAHATVDVAVSTDALADQLMKKVDPHRDELAMFNIARHGAIDNLLIDNPAVVPDRSLPELDLAFNITQVSNRSSTSYPQDWTHRIMVHIQPRFGG